MRKIKVELSPKEAFLLWKAVLQVKHPRLITGVLLHKLFRLITREERHKFRKRFDRYFGD